MRYRRKRKLFVGISEVRRDFFRGNRNTAMKEKRAEWMLGVLYVSSAILSLTSLISLLTVWRYWAWTLDVCISIDCGCILYGINTFRTFMGGDAKLCHFGVYGLIPAILISLFLGGYHGYRCCINKNLEEPVQVYNDITRYIPIGTYM